MAYKGQGRGFMVTGGRRLIPVRLSGVIEIDLDFGACHSSASPYYLILLQMNHSMRLNIWL